MALPELLQGNLRLPVIGAPMFIVSTPDLVLAQCKAGIVGAFPALNARPQSMLDEWLDRITGELEAYRKAHPDKPVAPFAVNQIVHASNDRLEADMETYVKYKVPIIITSLRPPSEVVDAVHGYGGLVFHDVINLRHARKAAEQDVDGIIAVCAGAGGHAGTLSPFALVKEIREFFDGTVILHDAMNNPGVYGGPLVNIDGEVQSLAFNPDRSFNNQILTFRFWFQMRNVFPVKEYLDMVMLHTGPPISRLNPLKQILGRN